ncbi:helix-turn-helix domain-containing protein [Desulfovibrio inopinatus]|uniref:helix-turn-helix domain-containing protein n=1 Tax=Desulfovibrio inopinatus TaxID=102109 RepID=UPI0004220FEA|nr:XRE family transcriptional regulator [Desulfovibrio inopinatus]
MTSLEKPQKEIAPRLRGLREAVGLTVEELAEKIGISAVDAAQYETGEVEIPVSYLFAVASLCQVDLTVLLSGGEAHLHEYSLVKAGQGLSVDRRKSYDYKSLAYRFSGKRMEPFQVTVPPRSEDQLSFTSHPGQEFIYVLEGRLEIRLGSKILELIPGDSLYFSSRTPHALRGLDNAPAQFLDVIN